MLKNLLLKIQLLLQKLSQKLKPNQQLNQQENLQQSPNLLNSEIDNQFLYLKLKNKNITNKALFLSTILVLYYLSIFFTNQYINKLTQQEITKLETTKSQLALEQETENKLINITNLIEIKDAQKLKVSSLANQSKVLIEPLQNLEIVDIKIDNEQKVAKLTVKSNSVINFANLIQTYLNSQSVNSVSITSAQLEKATKKYTVSLEVEYQ